MQHGTGREQAIDIIENVRAIVGRMKAHSTGALESYDALGRALEVLESTENLDEPGVYGKDYGFVPPVDLTTGRLGHPKVVKYLGPTGSIRDTRPEGLGR